jgi:DNA polymerase-3 subunit delta'
MPFRDVIGHDRPKAMLLAALRRDRLAHAYLFHGEADIGKRLLALRFAQAVNCDAEPGPDGPDACGACRSCRQIEAQTHPDVRVIEPDREAATPQIKIEQVREIESQVVYRPLVGRYKICLIDQADRMTIGAANALLKTLEEPPPHCLFLLVCDRPLALPATVRSRCQPLRLAAPAPALVEAELMARRGLPPDAARLLAAATEGRIGLALTADIEALQRREERLGRATAPGTLRSVAALLAEAEALAKGEDGAEALDRLAGWVRDALLLRVGVPETQILHRNRLPQVRELAAAADADALLDLLDHLDTLQRASARHLNLQLALESALLRLRDATMPAAPASPPARSV